MTTETNDEATDVERASEAIDVGEASEANGVERASGMLVDVSLSVANTEADAVGDADAKTTSRLDNRASRL